PDRMVVGLPGTRTDCGWHREAGSETVGIGALRSRSCLLSNQHVLAACLLSNQHVLAADFHTARLVLPVRITGGLRAASLSRSSQPYWTAGIHAVQGLPSVPSLRNQGKTPQETEGVEARSSCTAPPG